MKFNRLFFALMTSGCLSQLHAQTVTGTLFEINHPTLGVNGDGTSFLRVDPSGDFSSLRLRMGDEWTSNFSIGYDYYANGQWVPNFNLDGNGHGFFRGNVGIGTTSPGAKLSFNNLDDGTNQPDGITWYNPNPLVYGIYRTAGTWVAPNYQQLKLSWDTGIILDPGSAYGKSFVDVQGAGLRVPNGNLGIGTTAPASKLHINGSVARETLRIYLQGNSTNYLNIWQGSGGAAIDPIGTGLLYLGYDQPTNVVMGLTGSGVNSGSVGIGTATPGTYKLAVEGKIGAREVNVTTTAWSDYVFNSDYKLRPLSEVQQFIEENRHLPEVPSEKEVLTNGQNLGEMNAILLRKIEELTLYMIELKKENDSLKLRMEKIENEK